MSAGGSGQQFLTPVTTTTGNTVDTGPSSLTDGHVYFIHVVSGGFQLETTRGNTGLLVTPNLTNTHDAIHLSVDGIALTGTGTGEQSLVLNLTNSGTGGTQRLLGIGGAAAVAASLSGGISDGVPTAVSSGVGGGAINVQVANSTTIVKPTVRTEISGSATLDGTTVFVSAASQANGAASSSNAGGGIVSVGSASANITITNTVTSSLDSTAKINALQDASVVATSVEAPTLSAEVSGGGLIATANIDATATTTHVTLAEALGAITAGRTVLIEGREGFTGTGTSRSFAGGLGVDTNANTTISIGAGGGTCDLNGSTYTGSFSCAVTGAVIGGRITALTIFAAGEIGYQDVINPDGTVGHGTLDPSVTAVQVNGVYVNVRSASESDAFGAGSTAEAVVNVHSIAAVDLLGSAELDAATVQLHARAENQSYNLDSNARCACFAGSATANSNLNYYGTSRVTGETGSIIRTNALWADTVQSVGANLSQDAHGGFLVSHNGDNHYNSNRDGTNDLQQTRDFNWNTVVYLLGDPDPVLSIDSSGTIIAKSSDVTVSTNSNLSSPLSTGQTIQPGQTIYVGPILYTDAPKALFTANSVGSAGGQDNNSTIESANGSNNTPAEFIVQDSWDSVTVLNQSDRPMVMEGTGGLSSLAIETVNENLVNNPTAAGVIDISVDRGSDPDSNFQFGVLQAFIPTIVSVKSIRGPPATGFPLTFGGGIDNIIGTTTIENDRGDLVIGAATGDLATTSATYAFRSNQLHVIAPDGSIGCTTTDAGCTTSFALNAVMYQYGTGLAATPTVKPIVLDGNAYGDIHLTLQTIRRDGSTPATANITPVIGPLTAGHDIVIQVLGSLEGTDQGDVGTLQVNTYTPNAVPNTPFTTGTGNLGSDPVPDAIYNPKRHYWPDAANATVAVCWTATNCNANVLDNWILVAYGTASSPVNSDDTFADPNQAKAPGLIAGHDIYVHYGSVQSPATNTQMTFTLYTSVDATYTPPTTLPSVISTDNSGRIDLYTNGSITDYETAGNLRVGQIISTGSCTNLTLCATVPAADVTLASPVAVLDVSGDVTTAQETPTTRATNVIARNITITAGNNLLGLGSSISGTGGVGTPNDFLTVQVNADGVDATGHIGVLTVTDTAEAHVVATSPFTNLPPAGGGTYGVFITETRDFATNGDLEVNTVTTNGDATLTTEHGSILDARANGAGTNTAGTILAPNVIADNVDLQALNGSVGAVGNPLKVFSSANNSGGGSCTRSFGYAYQDAGFADATNGERTVSATCHLAAQADGSIDITETPGAANVSSPADVLLLLARNGHATLTTTETGVDGNEILLLHNGMTLVVENVPQTVPNGLIEAASGNVKLVSADDIVTDSTSQILATTAGTANTTPGADPNLPINTSGNIDIYGNSHTGFLDPYTGDGTVMVLRGEITPGLGGLTRVFGNGSADSITFDQTLLGGNTRAYGNALPTAPTQFAPGGDGEDTFTVYKLQSMTTGQALTLDGQDGTDHYVIWTHGSPSTSPYSYVVNVLDSGDPLSGVDNLDIYGADSSQNAAGDPTNDIFLLRSGSYIPNESAARPGVYCGQTGGPTSTCTNRPAYVALLHPVLTSGEDALTAVRQSNYAGVVERVNYDNAVNGRLAVYGLGGNDYYAVDDNAASTSLDGGAGNDTFQIGQTYGMRRDAIYSGLSPADSFPTIATTRGYLSGGTSEPLVALGGAGGDAFTVYSNQGTLRLEGNDGNDIFTVEAFALGQTDASGNLVMGPLYTGPVSTTTGTSAADCAAHQGTASCGQITRTDGGSFLTDGFRVGETLVMSGSSGVDDNTAATAHVITAVSATVVTLDVPLPVGASYTKVSLSPGPIAQTPLTVAAVGTNSGTITRSTGNFLTDGFLVGQTIALAGTGTADDNLNGLPYTITAVTATQIAFTVQSAAPGGPNPLMGGLFNGATVTAVIPTPILTNGFSTAAQTDVRTGDGQNQVTYNVNAPVSVDGGAGFNKLVVLGTEFADHIVVTSQGVFGAGLEVTYRNIQVLEIDALQGDDTIDVLSTPANMVVRVLGGLGSDTINAAGDVVGDVVAKDINGSSATINTVVTSSDPAYNNIVAPGINVDVARPTQGNVIITETGGATAVTRGGSCTNTRVGCTFDS
ncbi:MAG: hypothetical protein ACJ780_27065, partial [Solirubrobacteraceae bacterium]